MTTVITARSENSVKGNDDEARSNLYRLFCLFVCPSVRYNSFVAYWAAPIYDDVQKSEYLPDAGCGGRVLKMRQQKKLLDHIMPRNFFPNTLKILGTKGSRSRVWSRVVWPCCFVLSVPTRSNMAHVPWCSVWRTKTLRVREGVRDGPRKEKVGDRNAPHQIIPVW